MLLAQFRLFPEQASTTAGRVDALFFFLLATTGAVALLVAFLIIVFGFRYRRRPDNLKSPRIMGSNLMEYSWIIGTTLVFMVMFFWGVGVYFYVVQVPEDALEVYVVGKQWMWKVQHPGGQREINELHIPVGRPVRAILTSQDVIHSFYIPAFRIKVDVLPNRYVHTWFEATKPGVYHLFCSEYCGTGHAEMTGVVVAMEPQDYAAWLHNRAEGSLALEGRKLFLKYQCVTCHSADALARGPVLEGLYRTTVPLEGGGTTIADETYLRQSILDPDAMIVAGFQSIMPTFEGQMSEEELILLIEFIKSLEPGQTPDRVSEETPPAVHRPQRERAPTEGTREARPAPGAGPFKDEPQRQEEVGEENAEP